MESIAYIIDDSLEGVLCAVFAAYERKERPVEVGPEQGMQLAFGQEAVKIFSDSVKAERVAAGFERKLGRGAYARLWTCALSSDPDRHSILYRYMRGVFDTGRRFALNLAHDDVLAYEKIHKAVSSEAHYHKEFARFSEMENGVYYSKITPKNNIISLVMPHFVERFSIQPMLLHDPVHELCAVYDMKSWYLIATSELNVPAPTAEEKDYRRLWKRFYDAICVEGRENPKCRRTHLPMRYWKNMTEFQHYPEEENRKQDKVRNVLGDQSGMAMLLTEEQGLLSGLSGRYKNISD